MHRFFIPLGSIVDNTVIISGSLVHRLYNVLRLRSQEHVIVLDNTGWEYEVEIKSIQNDRIEGRIINKYISNNEPSINITLYQALLKGDSFEFVLQKCTEIGVSAFVPMLCERCVTGKPSKNKLERWQNIILEASQQCRRGRLPVLHLAKSFSGVCSSINGISLLPWEGETGKSIKSVLKDLHSSGNSNDIAIFIGPEGGFSSKEVELARQKGIIPITMGHRILRSETAGLVAATIILYECDQLGAESK